MPIQFSENLASFTEVCTVEEAEQLLQWLHDAPAGQLKLADCTHIHTAIVQVMMAGRAVIAWPPTDKDLARWLMPALMHDPQ